MLTVQELHSFLVEQQFVTTDFPIDELEESDWYVNLPHNTKCDRDIVLCIICNTLYSFWEQESYKVLCNVFEEKFSCDKDFIQQYLFHTNYENEFFCRASIEIQMNYELLKQYMNLGHPESRDYSSFRVLHQDIKQNRELMMRLLQDIPGVFSEFTEELKDDREITEIAIRQNGLFLEFASERLRSDQDFVKIAIENNIKAVLFSHKSLREFPDGIFYEEYWKVTNGLT
jgi:hypothetical protein